MLISISTVVFACTSLVYIILLVWIFRVRLRVSRGFALFFSLVIFLLIATALQLAVSFNLMRLIRTQTQARFPLYSVLIAAFLLLEVTRSVLHGKPLRWYWVSLFILWLGGSILLTENLNGMFLDRFQAGPWIFLRAGVAETLLLAGIGVPGLTALFDTIFTSLRTPNALHRNRTVFWLIALLLMAAGLILSLALPAWLPVEAVLVFLAALLMGSILSTHDLPDIRQAYRRSIAFLMSVVLYTLVYTAFLWLVEYLTRGAQFRREDLLQAALVAAVITLLLNPLIQALQRPITAMILRDSYNTERLLNEYGKKISNIIDLPQLVQVITQTIAGSLGIRQARLFLVYPRENGFNLLEVNPLDRLEDPFSLPISASSPFAGYLSSEHKPLSQYDLDLLPRFRTIPAPETASIKALGIDLYVPLLIQERWIGFLGLSARSSGDRYFEKELFILETLANQTAVVLENARLYQDLKLRNAENERLNAELTVVNSELARIDKAKSDFISIASHELRTPLTGIIGYNDMLNGMLNNGKPENKVHLQMVDGVRNAARRLQEIVETMFDVSKLDTSTLELSMAPNSINSILQSAIAKWKDALDQREQNLIMQGIDELPALSVDGKRLVQVFSNLIQNAIKFTPDGGEIRISGQNILDRTQGGEKQYIEVVVADTGIGIAPDELECIFDKFYRVGDIMLHSTGESKFKGAGPGLGLTICRGIVEAHGGRVWAESPGHDEQSLPGSKFHVLLPVIAHH